MLASAGAGWMVAGVFAGFSPRLVGLFAAVLGSGLVWLSTRMRRPSMLQYGIVPIALVAGALLVLPSATGGSANLPGLVAQAIRSGGLSQPPVPFEPGWRFILVVLVTLLGAAAASVGMTVGRPKLGILLPIPIIFVTALVQPKDAIVLSSVVALVLAIGAAAVAFGADLAGEGATSSGFELRRLGRGAALLGGLVAVLLALSQLGFLFPSSDQEQVIPPRRPPTPPAAPDRELFTVSSPVQLPWRVGVLDVYGREEQAWLTPPFNSGRLAKVEGGGAVPFLGKDGKGKGSTVIKAPKASGGRTVSVTFKASDLTGRALPAVASATRVRKGAFGVEYDPRTQSFRLTAGRARRGLTYTVVAPAPPTGPELARAGRVPRRLAEFLDVPAPPPAVREVLDAAPKTNLFDRLQFVRTAYYSRVVAAGAGNPVDVPPRRVAQMLEGKEASPYEIAAGEVLLARWAGVPARLGFGYYGGDPVSGKPNTYSVRPKHGAMWLETYFEGHGWVPIVGTPPKAKASITPKQKRNDPAVRPTDELALVTYVPVRLDSLQQLFEVVRYWAYRGVPAALGIVLLFLFYPGLLKLLRGARRRRWAADRGPAERIAVAYAELRDAANDFNLGDPMHTPLEFVRDFTDDAEHRELAWLVTRGLWGDLSRDLRAEDAEAAEDMAGSVTRRLRRANPGLPRLIAFGSRASLREPYTREIPNLWPERQGRRRRRVVVRQATPAMALVIVIGLVAGSCGGGSGAGRAVARATLPERLAPDTLDALRFVRETSAETPYHRAGPRALIDDGRVFSIHDGDTIQGSLQVATFKPSLAGQQQQVRQGLIKAIGAGRFELTRIGLDRVYVLRLPEQRLLLWFPPGGGYYVLMAVRQAFTQAEKAFVSVLDYQRGGRGTVDLSGLVPRPDPRRGLAS